MSEGVAGTRTVLSIENGRGMRARVADYGARLLELWTRDRYGHLDDVTLGFPTLDAYRAARSLYVGCTIGRVANRIRDARFDLDGVTYLLTPNEPPNHLHGGGAGAFDDRTWSIDQVTGRSVTFRLTSEHLEEGYPGRLEVTVTYTLTDRDELVVDYLAEPDRRTPVSLTNHAYWNLAGHESLRGVGSVRDALGHELWVRASSYAPSDAHLVPTGAILPLDGTPLDFRESRPLGARIGELTGLPTRGYDHTLILEAADPSAGEPRVVARLRDPVGGRVLELSTTEPALQLYSGQALSKLGGKDGSLYGPFAGLALEPGGVPNAVNEPRFPSVVVEPGSPYRQRSIYRFGID